MGVERRPKLLVGYSDRLSAAPGETLAFMVSSAHPAYDVEIVRLVHGDPNPSGPGLIERVVETPVSGTYPGRIQQIHTGSYVIVDDCPPLRFTGGFTIQAWIWPTTPGKGVQGLVAIWANTGPTGFALVIEDGALGLWLGDATGPVARVGIGASLHARTWYDVAVTFDAGTGEVRLVQEACPEWAQEPSSRTVTVQTELRALDAGETGLLMAALPGVRPGAVEGHFNGKIDRPSLFSRALSDEELKALQGGGLPLDLGDA